MENWLMREFFIAINVKGYIICKVSNRINVYIIVSCKQSCSKHRILLRKSANRRKLESVSMSNFKRYATMAVLSCHEFNNVFRKSLPMKTLCFDKSYLRRLSYNNKKRKREKK